MFPAVLVADEEAGFAAGFLACTFACAANVTRFGTVVELAFNFQT